MAEFEHLHCAPVANPQQHDLGTDLLVMIRDVRRFDRGLVIGVQVKTGPSWFREPVGDAAAPSGWVYREPVERFDDWVTHGLPHVLILRDQDAKRSYWVHVVESALTITGKQCSITVPADNVLGADSFDRLLDVAASQKAAKTYEGSAWTAGVGAVPPARRWRYSLLAPRLVAPHPNRKIDSLDPVEALALSVSGRFREWEMMAGKGLGPIGDDARGHKDWGWRFAARCADWFTSRDASVLEEDPAPDVFAETAQLVMRSIVLGSQDRVTEAFEVLDRRLSDGAAEDLRPVDHAWVLTHLARRSAEMGAVEVARTHAVEALKALSGDDDDPTATDLASANALLLLNTTQEWTPDSYAETASRLDTATSWWRSRLVTSALRENFKRDFDSWARDDSVTFRNEDRVAVDLQAAADGWDLNGSAADWRASGSSLHRYLLIRAVNHGVEGLAASSLWGLCQTGDDGAIKKAARHMRNHGPLRVLRTIASDIPDEAWTATSAPAILRLWEVAADLMTPESAERAAALCMAALEDEESVIRRRAPRMRIVPAVTSALTSLLPVAPPEIHRLASSYALGGATGGGFADPMWESEIRPMLDNLDFSLLDSDERDAWFSLSDGATERWSATVLSRLAEAGDERARDLYVGRAIAGDLKAVYGLSADALGDEGAQAVIHNVTPLLGRMVDDAEKGSWSHYTDNYGEVAGWISINYPHLADWATLTRFATSPRVAPREKVALLARFASSPDAIPTKVRATLLDQMASVAQTFEPLFGDRGSAKGVAFQLEVALNGGDPETVDRAIASLIISNSHDEREHAAVMIRMANNDALLPALGGLLNDSDHRVAAHAAYIVGACVGRDSGAIGPLVQRAAESDGRPIPLALLSGLSEAPSTERGTALAADATKTLLDHPSAQVREAATQLLERLAAEGPRKAPSRSK